MCHIISLQSYCIVAGADDMLLWQSTDPHAEFSINDASEFHWARDKDIYHKNVCLFLCADSRHFFTYNIRHDLLPCCGHNLSDTTADFCVAAGEKCLFVFDVCWVLKCIKSYLPLACHREIEGYYSLCPLHLGLAPYKLSLIL